jgi:hypothetical protein
MNGSASRAPSCLRSPRRVGSLGYGLSDGRHVRRIVRDELEAASGTAAVRIERQVIEVNPQRLYSVAAVAELFDVSPSWVYERIKNGEMAVIELGDTRAKQRISTPEVQRYIDSRTFGGVKRLPDPIEQYKNLGGRTAAHDEAGQR